MARQKSENTAKNLEIKYLPIEEIIPYDKNPRFNENAVDAVAKSIKQFGFKNPILLDANKVIIAGHTRHLAAIKNGMKQVPCVICEDLTEEQARALRIVDNRTNELALWNIDILKSEVEELKEFGYDLEGYELEPLLDTANLDIGIDVAKINTNEGNSADLDAGDDDEEGTKHKCPNCGYEW